MQPVSVGVVLKILLRGAIGIPVGDKCRRGAEAITSAKQFCNVRMVESFPVFKLAAYALETDSHLEFVAHKRLEGIIVPSSISFHRVVGGQ